MNGRPIHEIDLYKSQFFIKVKLKDNGKDEEQYLLLKNDNGT